MKHARIFISLFAVLTAILLSLSMRSAKAQDETNKISSEVKNIKTDTAKFENDCSEITFSGFLEGRNQAEVGAKVQGEIIDIAKKEGDEVRAGETIISIDPKTASVGVQNAQDSLNTLEKTKKETRKYFSRLVDEAETAKKNADDSENNSTLDAAKKSLKSARAAKDLQTTLVGSQIAAAQGALSSAGAQLENFTIKAPFSGTLVRLNVKAGDFAAPGAPLFVVADRSELELKSSLENAEAEKLKIGQEVTLRGQNDSGKGVITALSPAGDPTSLKTLVSVAVREGNMQLGDFIKAFALTSESKTYLTIDKNALVKRYDDFFVFLVEADNHVREQKVELGKDCQDRQIISVGLGENDQVATDGRFDLKNNDTVKIYGN